MTSLDSEALRAIFFQQISSCFHGGDGLLCAVTNLETGRVKQPAGRYCLSGEARLSDTLHCHNLTLCCKYNLTDSPLINSD